MKGPSTVWLWRMVFCLASTVGPPGGTRRRDTPGASFEAGRGWAAWPCPIEANRSGWPSGARVGQVFRRHGQNVGPALRTGPTHCRTVRQKASWCCTVSKTPQEGSVKTATAEVVIALSLCVCKGVPSRVPPRSKLQPAIASHQASRQQVPSQPPPPLDLPCVLRCQQCTPQRPPLTPHAAGGGGGGDVDPPWSWRLEVKRAS